MAPKAEGVIPSASMTEEERKFNDSISRRVLAMFAVTSTHDKIADNDWMLIVKLHAMIETSLNGVLTARCGEPELEPVFACLDTSNAKSGKIAFALALGIISKNTFTFIGTLSHIRNLCVHNLYNFEFDLSKYLFELPKEKQTETLKGIRKGILSGKNTSHIQNDLLLATKDTITQLHVNRFNAQRRNLLRQIYKEEYERRVPPSERAQTQFDPML